MTKTEDVVLKAMMKYYNQHMHCTNCALDVQVTWNFLDINE